MSIVEGLITKLLAKGVIDASDLNDIAEELDAQGLSEEAHIARCLPIEAEAREKHRTTRPKLRIVPPKV